MAASSPTPRPTRANRSGCPLTSCSAKARCAVKSPLRWRKERWSDPPPPLPLRSPESPDPIPTNLERRYRDLGRDAVQERAMADARRALIDVIEGNGDLHASPTD